MTGRQLTTFEHILLGLLCATPSSGYDLKRRFATTPMGVYQPSSGALYPALRRLDATGLIRAEAQPRQAGRPARNRRVYEATRVGRAVHSGWLSTPIEPATVGRDLGLHLMRFVMMEHVLSPGDVLTFLHSLADALAAFVAQLDQFATAADLGDRHPRLALEHGLVVHRASLRWARQAIKALSAPE
jgi:DNA-binding PadR family transcriptional regulator